MKLVSGSTQSRSWLAAALCLLLGSRLAASIQLQTDNQKSIKNAASIAAKGLLQYYTGDKYGGTPGLIGPPYYWWEGGAMWMTLIDYWWYTGDTQYNEIIMKGIQFQTGPDANFILSNQSFDNGNDDQAFWAFAAMEAAELKFPNPPKDKPQWLALAQAVFNVQLTRFTPTCGGGLPWQVTPLNPGYYYKNTISNGCFFALAARLARYTGNATYAHYANTTYDWVEKAGLISSTYQIWDGVDTTANCLVNGIQWTYNAGVFLHGAASMWSFSKDEIWRKRIDGIMSNIHTFFEDGVLYEQFCEGSTIHPCNNDQQSFKGYLARWMAVSAQLAPWIYPQVMHLLKKSARAAAAQCVGGDTGTDCGLRWIVNGTTGPSIYDSEVGPGEQIDALSVFGALMTPPPNESPKSGNGHLEMGPVTHVQGISKGNPSAGLGGASLDIDPNILNISTGDRAGAWILTVVCILATLCGAVWCIRDDGKPFSYLAKSPSNSNRHVNSLKEKSSMWPSPSLNSPKVGSPAINSPIINSPKLIKSPKLNSPKADSPRVDSPKGASSKWGSPRVRSPPISIPPASKRTSINSKRANEIPSNLRQPPPSPA